MTAFAERLRNLRLNQNVMAKTMASELGITPRNYQRYERGEVDPPTSKTVFLADFFNVSTDYLLGRTDVPEVYHYHKPNTETIAAMKEAEDILSGKIPAKTFNSVEELMEDLMSDDEDQKNLKI